MWDKCNLWHPCIHVQYLRSGHGLLPSLLLQPFRTTPIVKPEPKTIIDFKTRKENKRSQSEVALAFLQIWPEMAPILKKTISWYNPLLPNTYVLMLQSSDKGHRGRTIPTAKLRLYLNWRLQQNEAVANATAPPLFKNTYQRQEVLSSSQNCFLIMFKTLWAVFGTENMKNWYFNDLGKKT